MFSNVLLPQPDGPISDTTSPSAIERLTPSTATTTLPCRGLAKRLVTLRNSRRGSSWSPCFWRRVVPSMPPTTAHSANISGLGVKSRGVQFSVSTSSSA